METKDYYLSLGISRNATTDEIRTAYHKLAMRFHPDHNPNNQPAEEKFKEINEAYHVLSEPQERAQYDRRTSAPAQTPRNTSTQTGFRAQQAHTTANVRVPLSKEQAVKFVVQGLGSFQSRDELIIALCEKTGMQWAQADLFIREVRLKQGREIASRRTPTFVVLAAVALVVVLVIAGVTITLSNVVTATAGGIDPMALVFWGVIFAAAVTKRSRRRF